VNSEASTLEEMVASLIVKPHAEAGTRLSSALQAFDAKGLSKSALVPLTVGRPMSGKAHVVKLEQPVTSSRKTTDVRSYFLRRWRDLLE